ncbi:hypothetical protein ND861_10295 [Leptospira sp. 2 VSF19]|uniref:DUF1508 domain-containing protein n=1 Tax=Leptospira soteropolitanensis TaxID=2950025 RepID=A0AAW5VDF7_9LEPT|nr:hypothetical protein [Leptospira soteropolitanensis]MCW7494753.1 hypothetical protein [Leptospira soteropolitanensis]MCW7500625.1 hypothetical protein [Leptospira soteropolitanensis]MCW7523156.1 hypothetical protein [Leptospira soteropolitanensis]MCW7526737.1 hypothetical protein [Leptospira soteropolitanensis]MCW7530874.1 hypothetical protein [Leptospira soteropolitanensis]
MDLDIGRYKNINYTLNIHQVEGGAMYWFVVERYNSKKIYYSRGEKKKGEIIRELKIECEEYIDGELLKKVNEKSKEV